MLNFQLIQIIKSNVLKSQISTVKNIVYINDTEVVCYDNWNVLTSGRHR